MGSDVLTEVTPRSNSGCSFILLAGAAGARCFYGPSWDSTNPQIGVDRRGGA